jgi:hypothetical protein
MQGAKVFAFPAFGGSVHGREIALPFQITETIRMLIPSFARTVLPNSQVFRSTAKPKACRKIREDRRPRAVSVCVGRATGAAKRAKQIVPCGMTKSASRASVARLGSDGLMWFFPALDRRSRTRVASRRSLLQAKKLPLRTLSMPFPTLSSPLERSNSRTRCSYRYTSTDIL